MSGQPTVDGRTVPRAASRGVLHAQEIAEPPPSRARLADLLGPAGSPPVSRRHGNQPTDARMLVILTSEADRALNRATFSRHIEEGGFLLGRRHVDADHPGRDLLVVTEVLAARGTGSRHSFRFPAESFLDVAAVVARRGPGTRLLGWYHTHVAAITADGGLSRIDVDLHRCVFRLPWQVAALVELAGPRSGLRVFYLDEDTPREAVLWTPAPADQHRRPAR